LTSRDNRHVRPNQFFPYRAVTFARGVHGLDVSQKRPAKNKGQGSVKGYTGNEND
jgi:hypothetical protein